MFEASEETLKAEELVKDRLCQELNMLVQQSAHAQLEKLEQVRPDQLPIPADMPCLRSKAVGLAAGPWCFTMARVRDCENETI